MGPALEALDQIHVFFLNFWVEIWESYSSSVAVLGAVSFEPPSLSTQPLLLTQPLGSARKMYDMSQALKSASVPVVQSQWWQDSKSFTKQTWQNIPSECRC